MRDVLKLKKKYQSSRIDLFKKLASTNDGFYFNKNHTDLVDTVVKEIVKGIYNIYPIEDFSLIAVGGTADMTCHQKVMLTYYLFIKNLIKI